MAAMLSDPSFAWLDAFIDHVSGNDFDTNTADLFPQMSSPSSQGSSASHTTPQTPAPDPSSVTSRQTSSPPAGPSQATSSKSGTKPPRRRIRPKIALDPSQPLTASGKQRARVYVACDQCRIRKTRCDGAKPICFNCRKRPPEVGSCSYDMQPKRRGQDKVPGTRVRTTDGRRTSKRRRMANDEDDDDDEDEDEEEGGRSQTESRGRRSCGEDDQDPTQQTAGTHGDVHDQSSDDEYDPFPLVDLDAPSANCEFYLGQYAEKPSIPPLPSLQFTRDTWWEALLTFYSTEESSIELDMGSLTSEQRKLSVQRVIGDLRALFHSALHWMSFINLPRFFDSLLNPTKRINMQPSLVIAALAVGRFAQSSEAEQGPRGRAKALKLLDLAHSSLQGSLASGWVDIGLIQAAWLLVYFEMQSHPRHSIERGRSALLLLDSLVRLFSLTTLDADVKRTQTATNAQFLTSVDHVAPPLHQLDHDARTTPPYMGSAMPGFFQSSGSLPFPLATAGVFNQYSPFPAELPVPNPNNLNMGSSTGTHAHTSGCNCLSLTLAEKFPSIRNIAPSWVGTLMWPENISEGEFRKEECRRLVWASVTVSASLNSYTAISGDYENKLWIKDPTNYALLFPGEILARYGVPVQTNNMWTLHSRTMLLLHKVVADRADPTLDEAQRAHLSMTAWLEIDAIEQAFNAHTCDLEKNFGYQAREMLFSARMCVSHEFQRYIPQVTTSGSRLFYRDKAVSWLQGRIAMAQRVWDNLLKGVQAPALDYRRPVLIYWFMSHIFRCMVLWKQDKTLLIALEAAKIFIKRAEYLMMFWPSHSQRREWQGLRFEVVEACLKTGVPPPEVALPGPVPRLRNHLE